MPYQYKLRISDRHDVEQGTVTRDVAADAVIEEGVPLDITDNVITEFEADGDIDAVSYGPITGGTVDGAVTEDVQELRIGSKLYGHLIEAIPDPWQGVSVGLNKGSGNIGYRFALASGDNEISGSDVFAIHSIKDAAIGDTNALIEVVKTA